MPVIPQESSETLSRSEVVYNGSERQTVGDQRHATHGEMVTSTTLTGGSSLEVIGTAGAAVLAIIGLAGYLPTYMAAVATIVIGGALLAHGAAVTARWSHAMRQIAPSTADRVEMAGGLGSELLGGACGIVLGILGLANVEPVPLLAVAAIVFGGAIVLSAPAQPELARLAPDRDPKVGRLTYEAVEGSAGAMMLAGLGSIVLGILGLVGVGPALTLVLVAMLAVSCALLLSGTALTARFARRLQQSM
jgi:hypothetical protein